MSERRPLPPALEERTALAQHFEAMQRLKALGWREMHFAPTDGTVVLVVEPHSTGLHRARVMADTNGWWVEDADDLWPSHPMLWKPMPDVHSQGSAT